MATSVGSFFTINDACMQFIFEQYFYGPEIVHNGPQILRKNL